MGLLEEFVEKYPMPKGWGQPRAIFHSYTNGDFYLNLVAVTAEGPGGLQLFGSAADPIQPPIVRAYFELLERISVIEGEAASELFHCCDSEGNFVSFIEKSKVFLQSDDPQQWKYSKSNGNALEKSFIAAARAAFLELIERDRILRSWFGQFSPRPVPITSEYMPKALEKDFHFEVFSFNPFPDNAGPEVIGLFGFPREKINPLVFSFGAGFTLADALSQAKKEFYQRLGFLWGESLPSTPPPFEASALYHQEFFLYPPMMERIKSWLWDSAKSRSKLNSTNEEFNIEFKDASFVDITPRQLKGKLFVVKAQSEKLLPLTFGRKNPEVKKYFTGDVPEELLIHPIA